jgi:hypothetical protein
LPDTVQRMAEQTRRVASQSARLAPSGSIRPRRSMINSVGRCRSRRRMSAETSTPRRHDHRPPGQHLRRFPAVPSPQAPASRVHPHVTPGALHRR